MRAPLDILKVEDLHCRSLGAVSLLDQEVRCLTADPSPWLYEQYQSRKVAGPRPNLRKVAAYGHRLVLQMVLAVAQYQSDLGQTQSQGCPHGLDLGYDLFLDGVAQCKARSPALALCTPAVGELTGNTLSVSSSTEIVALFGHSNQELSSSLSSNTSEESSCEHTLVVSMVDSDHLGLAADLLLAMQSKTAISTDAILGGAGLNHYSPGGEIHSSSHWESSFSGRWACASPNGGGHSYFAWINGTFLERGLPHGSCYYVQFWSDGEQDLCLVEVKYCCVLLKQCLCICTYSVMHVYMLPAYCSCGVFAEATHTCIFLFTTVETSDLTEDCGRCACSPGGGGPVGGPWEGPQCQLSGRISSDMFPQRGV